MPFALKIPRRNPDAPRPSFRERTAALKASAAKVMSRRKPAPAADPILAAIAASKAATAAFDAIEAELSGCRMTPELLGRENAISGADLKAMRAVWETVPTTPAGRRALVEFARFRLSRVTHPDGRVDDPDYWFGLILDAFGAMVAADRSTLTPALDTGASPDPHVALLPALRQAYAWDRASRPIGNTAAMNSFEEEASGAVQRHCWDTAGRIIALPAPQTLPGLGALALALSITAEEAIGSPGYEEERRHAAAVRAMMSIAGVDPLPDWCGFGDELDARERYPAMLERIGAGSLPDWALAGKSGPDAEDTATSGDMSPADLPKAASLEAPDLDLSGYSIPQLCALFDVYERAEDQFQADAWWPKLGDAGSDLMVNESDRCTAMKNAVEAELSRRIPRSEVDADDRAEKLMRRALRNGDWDATARLVSSLRNEVVAFIGKH